jgi:2'-5' RNA ligase
MRKRMNYLMNLYFIAILPPLELRQRVFDIKEDMKERFGARHALKSPAHITLQKPFRRFAEEEAGIADALKMFAGSEHLFSIVLDGFGCFAPRVIFIKVTDTEPVVSLHARLREMLLVQLHFTPGEIMKDVQPHITIATRDLTPEAFRDAWPEKKEEHFSGTFAVRSICLLKHNGRNWDILEEFPFENNCSNTA